MNNSYVKIEEVLRMSPNMQLVVTAADLKEFALSLIEEVKCASESNREDETLYTPAEFASRHHVDKSTLWRWCKSGILTPTRVGGKVFYKDSNLQVIEK